ncbi:GNAT family N-acetyltransferase [Rossellomorea sp. NPDC077527]|uniref:GNAT family N-acetyltransferase n=1 Tax=Rossellomorea sp. NPDC077527 TaxID=3364510 RepID=UPI0037C7C299
MTRIEISRPMDVDKDELILFFDLVIRDTFDKEGLSTLQEDIQTEIKTKIQYLQSDYDSNGGERYFLIAKVGGTIVGTVEYGPSSVLINTVTNGSLKELFEIGTVFVHPEYQRRGIGTLLFNIMLLTFQSKGIDEFCLDSGYSTSQKVWTRKLGDPDYCLKDYWGEGSGHMIWKRNIKDVPITFIGLKDWGG